MNAILKLIITFMNNTKTMNSRGFPASSSSKISRRRSKLISSSSSSSSMMTTTTIDGRLSISPNVLFLIGLLMYICVFLNVWITSFQNSIVGMKQLVLDDFKKQVHQGPHRKNTRSIGRSSSSEPLLEVLRTNERITEVVSTSNKPPPIYVAIPTVPRDQDVDYLLRVLKSLDTAKFPFQNTHVFYNGNPNLKTHKRWNQAEALYGYQGVHFLWNDNDAAPQQQQRASSYYHDSIISTFSSSSQTLPEGLLNLREAATDADVTSINIEELKERWLPRIEEASKDSLSRKKWRQKECNDFLTISQYMLREVVYKDADMNNQDDMIQRNNSWIIFNQDDAIWSTSIDFPTGIYEMLMDDVVDASSEEEGDQQDITRHDFYETGLVSAAFKASSLLDIVVDLPTKELCNVLPVDWMLWFLDDIYPNRFKSKRSPKVVKHIGKVSSRQGIVANEPTQVVNTQYNKYNNRRTTTQNPKTTTTTTSGSSSPSKAVLPDYI